MDGQVIEAGHVYDEGHVIEVGQHDKHVHVIEVGHEDKDGHVIEVGHEDKDGPKFLLPTDMLSKLDVTVSMRTVMLLKLNMSMRLRPDIF